MSGKAFDKIAEGLTEAVKIAKGEAKPAKLHVPVEINVKAIRLKLELSQDDFAANFGFSINQIRDWEQGRSHPIGGVRAYLMLIDRNPITMRDMLRKAAQEQAA